MKQLSFAQLGTAYRKVRFTDKAPIYLDYENTNPLTKALGKKFGGGNFIRRQLEASLRWESVCFPGHDGRVNLNMLMEYLGSLNRSTLLEGGGNLNENCAESWKMRIFIAGIRWKGEEPCEGLWS